MSLIWTDPDFIAIVDIVAKHAGLDFIPERRASVEIGIRRAMTHAGIESLSTYLKRLSDHSRLLQDLLNELTVGETYFFREPAQFQYVRDVLMPEYRTPAYAGRMIRVWSAACSSGEEPYSLAMLFEEAGLADRLHLMATDISAEALNKAKKAVYSDWSFRGESGKDALRHMSRREKLYEVIEPVRRRVSFSLLNLASERYPALIGGPWEMDLIFCRNVLIYFDRKTVRAVARRLFDTLTPGGWLITASSDPTMSELAPFEPVVTALGVFYRRPATVPWPLPRIEAPPKISGLPSPPRSRQGADRSLPDLGSKTALPPPAFTSVSVAEETESRDGLLLAIHKDLLQGHYTRVVDRTTAHKDDVDFCVLNVKALANLDASKAEEACGELLTKHPLSTELSYLRTVLLADQGKLEEACSAARKVIYLDRKLAIAHFFLGGLLRRRGDREGASRAYRNAQELCMARPVDEEVPLSDGQLAGRLAEAARLQIERLTSTPGAETP